MSGPELVDATLVSITVDVAGTVTALTSLIVSIASWRRVNHLAERSERLRRAAKASNERRPL